ncbi:hypothetical protein FB451DRAFT_1394487 [Mycena latifolia]|nr:hypothetical protein FB451DRAFT_1394487 [Mycena latifolia]
MESGSNTASNHITRIFFAFQLFSIACERSKLSAEISAEMWPRTWTWILFVDIYRNYVHPLSPPQLYSILVKVVCQFRFPAFNAGLVTATPGWRRFITRTWAVFVAAGDFTREPNFYDLCQLMVDDFAHRIPKIFENFLKGPFQLLLDTNDNPEFCRAIFKQGLIKVLTAMICRFAVEATVDDMLGSCLKLIIGKIAQAPNADSYRWMAQAIKSGILRAIVLRCNSDIGKFPPQMEYFLQDGILMASVFYPVVIQLEPALRDLLPLTSLPSFRASALAREWDNFTVLGAECIRVMKDYSKGAHPTLRICDNVECAKITTKHEVMECSACKLAHYCSWKCQLIDWRVGGHRHDCDVFTSSGPREPEHLSARGRSFLCSLVQSDYHAQRHSILLHKIALMYERPDDTFCMFFNYKTSPFSMSMVPFVLD